MSDTARQAAIAAAMGISVGVSAPVRQDFSEIIRLTLSQVQPFESNPRTVENPKYTEIKQSIQNAGLHSRMTVVKRPGEEIYTLARGGGTRYQILCELYEETKDEKFNAVDYELIPFTNDDDLYISHAIENGLRGDMCFWDNAESKIRILRIIERRFDTRSVKESIRHFPTIGCETVGSTLMFYYEFAVERLIELGNLKYKLTLQVIKDCLQPGFNGMDRLFNKHPKISDDFYESCWKPACTEFASTYEATGSEIPWADLVAQAASKLAELFKTSPEGIQAAVAFLRQASKASWEELLVAMHPQTDLTESGNELQEEDEDRPPQHAVEQYEEQQRRKRQPEVVAPKQPIITTDGVAVQSGDAVSETKTQAELPHAAPQQSYSDEPSDSQNLQSPTLTESDFNAQLATQRAAQVVIYARALACHTPTLHNLFIECEAAPLGYLIDLPSEAMDTPLPPQAKEIWWFLATCSFQLQAAVSAPACLSGTKFATFFENQPIDETSCQYWAKIKPSNSDFLISWLMDPAYQDLGNKAHQLLSATRTLLANHPGNYTNLDNWLDFEDVQTEFQSQRLLRESEELAYFRANGASAAMLTTLFSHVTDLPEYQTPQNIPTTAQFAIHNAWRSLYRQPSDRARFMALHQQFPHYSLGTLFNTVRGE